MSESDYSKVEAWECDYCCELYTHPSLAERCAIKCKWESLVERIAEEKKNNGKLEKARRIETLEQELEDYERN